MHLFFLPHLRNGETIIPDAGQVRHIRALRLQEGDEVSLTDGHGHLATGILEGDRKTLRIVIRSMVTSAPQVPFLTVIIAPTKNHDRLEWFVEKAVEIGVHRICLAECDNSERPVVRVDRLQRMAITALQQSQRYYLPEIETPKPFIELLEKPWPAAKFIAHCHPESTKPFLRDVLTRGADAVMAIGPEGDFSRDEVYRAEQAGWLSVSLGKSRLRTETAGLTAVHTFELTNQV